MRGLCAFALLVLLAACHFDKLFSGGGTERPLSHGTPTGLVFATPPANTRAGEALPAVRVAIVDSAGVPVAGADSMIAISLGNHPTGATLNGTASKRAVNGVAVFDDLRIDTPANDYTLSASGGGLGPQESASFNVMPGPATTGDLTVTTTTSGGGTDPDGYTITVDAINKPIGVSGSVTFNGLPAGDHSVTLTGLASNCTVNGQNPRTINVPAGGTPQTNFAVTCNPPANQPPTARFTSSCNGLTCSFTSTSSDPDGTITNQQWSFGDGGMGSGGNPSHTYGSDGKYTVTFTVTDNQGAQDVVTQDVTVSTQPPVVDAGGDQTVLLSVLNFTLNASFTDPDNDGPWSYLIDWGDNTGSTTGTATSPGPITANHRYPALSGTHTLRVTVTDQHGNVGTGTATIRVGV